MMPADGMTGAGGPQPAVRLAGLPVSVVTELRFTATAARVARLSSEQDWLATEGDALADELYSAIGAAHGTVVKPRLVGLRRAVHRMRPPAPAEWDTPVRRAVPTDVGDRVDAWLGRLQQWRQERAELPAILARESHDKAAVLRQVAGDPGFRRALWLSSQSLSRELDKWLAAPADGPRRQSIARLAKYVTRAATKTSPYSAFASSGLGGWSGPGPAVRVDPEPALRGVLELSEFVRGALSAALLRHPLLVAAVPVRRNPSVVVADGTVSFLGRPPAEPVLALPVTAAVRECLDLLSRSGQVTVGELRSQLAAAGGTDVAAVTGFVSHLLDSGLLVPQSPVPGLPPPLAQLADWVARHGGDELADVAELLRALAWQLSEPDSVTDLAGFRTRHRALLETVDALGNRLDLTDRLGLGPRPTDPPWPVLHDSVVWLGEAARCAVPATARADLERVGRWLAVFDSALPLRLALADLWRGWLEPGARVPFLTLHRLVQQAAAGSDPRSQELRRLLSGEYVAGAVSSSEFPAVQQLLRLRDRALAPLRETTEDPDGVVRVDPAALGAVAASWPGWINPVRSLGCYVQPLPPGDECSLVLNMTNTGYGQGRTRLRYLLAQAGAPPPVNPDRYPPEDPGLVDPTEPELAELGGAHGTTLNHRSPAVAYEIEYPFTDRGRSEAECLPLGDLAVELDPERGLLRLHSARLGREVRALALGLLTTPALPPAARLLALAFGDKPMAQVGARGARQSPSAGIRRYPRVVAGRVVLHRGTWVGRATEVPHREVGEDAAGYLLRLARWRRAAGVPSRCFVRALPTVGDTPGARLLEKSRKPVYIDFDNWFLVLVFENMLRSYADLLVFEEALPDPEQATEPAGEPRAVELLVEIGQYAGAAVSAVGGPARALA